MTDGSYNVLLVDSHPIIREGLRDLLARQSGIQVCGEAAGVTEAIRKLKELRPDVMIVDISLGTESGLDLIRLGRAHHPSLIILVLSMLDERIYAERAIRNGANGYVMKQAATDLLIVGLRKVLAGKMFVSEAVADVLLAELARPGSTRPRFSVDRLTDRELEIFRLTGMGAGTAKIAERLSISSRTVETHKTRIKEKLGAKNATALVIQSSAWVRDGTPREADHEMIDG